MPKSKNYKCGCFYCGEGFTQKDWKNDQQILKNKYGYKYKYEVERIFEELFYDGCYLDADGICSSCVALYYPNFAT